MPGAPSLFAHRSRSALLLCSLLGERKPSSAPSPYSHLSAKHPSAHSRKPHLRRHHPTPTAQSLQLQKHSVPFPSLQKNRVCTKGHWEYCRLATQRKKNQRSERLSKVAINITGAQLCVTPFLLTDHPMSNEHMRNHLKPTLSLQLPKKFSNLQTLLSRLPAQLQIQPSQNFTAEYWVCCHLFHLGKMLKRHQFLLKTKTSKESPWP